MTPEQIAELEALAEKATPGSWEVEEDPTQGGDHATLVCLSGKFGTMGTWLLGCFHNWKEAAKGERRISWKEAESNAALIVALVNNLPAILAALKAQEPGDDVVERVARALAPHMEGGREFDQMPHDRMALRKWAREGMCNTNDATQDDALEAAQAAIAAMQEKPND